MHMCWCAIVSQIFAFLISFAVAHVCHETVVDNLGVLWFFGLLVHESESTPAKKRRSTSEEPKPFTMASVLRGPQRSASEAPPAQAPAPPAVPLVDPATVSALVAGHIQDERAPP